MKARELIEKLKGYEDFDIELSIPDLPRTGPWIDYTHYDITGIEDIGYSSKVIKLDAEVREE